MIKSCDSGSFPFIGDYAKFLEDVQRFGLNHSDESAEYFEKKIVENFLDKIDAGIDVPNYPQFRDMSEMFLSIMDGVEKLDTGYIETGVLSLKSGTSKMPEVLALEKNAQQIREKKGEHFEARVCITGPYTLSSYFPYKDERIFGRLGKIISKILETSLFSNKQGKTSLVSVDEPLFGLLDDPQIDFGSEGRKDLQNAWETIFQTVKSKNVQTMLHLHSTANPLFWDIKSLDIIDSHVDDPITRMKKTGELLESKDKFLKASITVNDFDALIKQKIASESPQLGESDINEKIADTWTNIKNKTVDPQLFLDTTKTMTKRLTTLVERFGRDRILYAGPECGLKAYPTYKNALECLRRVSAATNSIK
jgi:5-methyltetrahydropteroyltriglutamate--homocysteine methyltransferase